MYSPGWPETCYAIKNDLECLVLLPPESWDHRHVLATTSGLYGLGTEARVLCVRQTLYQPSHIPNLSLLRVSVTHILMAHVAIKEGSSKFFTAATMYAFWNVLQLDV